MNTVSCKSSMLSWSRVWWCAHGVLLKWADFTLNACAHAMGSLYAGWVDLTSAPSIYFFNIYIYIYNTFFFLFT